MVAVTLDAYFPCVFPRVPSSLHSTPSSFWGVCCGYLGSFWRHPQVSLCWHVYVRHHSTVPATTTMSLLFLTPSLRFYSLALVELGPSLLLFCSVSGGMVGVGVSRIITCIYLSCFDHTRLRLALLFSATFLGFTYRPLTVPYSAKFSWPYPSAILCFEDVGMWTSPYTNCRVL